MKKRVINKKVKNKSLTTLILIIIILVLATIYYFANGNKLERRSNLVGEKVCNSFPTERGQDDCCINIHKDDIMPGLKCNGNWKYLNGIDKCQYVCDRSLPSCPKDAKVCSDNSVVERNPSSECEFYDC